MRKLITKRIISEIKPIEGADFIELARVDGWHVVVLKDQFKVGDEAYYFEIDSFLPTNIPQFAEFAKKGLKNVVHPETGVEVQGHVLKTIKLRGQVSQGLLLEIKDFDQLNSQEEIDEYFKNLGVFKYEKPISEEMIGIIIGEYPTHITERTDSERVQNFSDEFLQSLNPEEWIATEKIDGRSSTFMKLDGKLRVFTRNSELEISALTVDHPYKQMTIKYNIDTLLKEGHIIKGEIYGEGIQTNSLRVKGKHLAIFKFEGPGELDEGLKKLWVPIYDLKLPKTVEESVDQAFKLKSLIAPNKNSEGIVWTNIQDKTFAELGWRSNFKAINNQFLLKE